MLKKLKAFVTKKKTAVEATNSSAAATTEAPPFIKSTRYANYVRVRDLLEKYEEIKIRFEPKTGTVVLEIFDFKAIAEHLTRSEYEDVLMAARFILSNLSNIYSKDFFTVHEAVIFDAIVAQRYIQEFKNLIMRHEADSGIKIREEIATLATVVTKLELVT